MTSDKIQLLKRHPCALGLDEETLADIASHCEVVVFQPGEYLHRRGQRSTSIFLLINGRMKQSFFDIRGNVIVELHRSTGAVFGALVGALSDPTPIEIVTEEPAKLLRLDYSMGLLLTRKHEEFRANFSKIIADAVLSVLMKDRRQSKPRIVAVFHQSPETRPILRRLVLRLRELGEHPHLFSDQANWEPIENVPFFCLIRNETYVSAEAIREQSNGWANADRILFDIDSQLVDQDQLFRILEVCEKAFWCVTPDNWQRAVPRVQKLVASVPGWCQKINLIWQLPGDCRFAPLAPELNQLARRNFKITFETPPDNQSRELLNGFERIIHQLRGIRIGIALGGGAARGMAHLGVLKTLEENGIVVDMICGTSVGAMTGILYASGMEPDYNVDCFAQDLRPSWLFRHLPNGGYWYLLYKYRRGHFDPMLRKYLHDSRLEQLAIPVESVTVDLIGGRPVVRSEFDSVHAITESINLPVLSQPINRDGQSLVDGGIVNNVPADLLVAHGCNFVIAVSVTADLEQEFARNRPDTPTPEMKTASTLSTILRTYLVQSVNMNSVGVAPADFVIAPNVMGFDITEFTRAREMATIGSEAAQKAMPKLKELLHTLDADMFPLDT